MISVYWLLVANRIVFLRWTLVVFFPPLAQNACFRADRSLSFVTIERSSQLHNDIQATLNMRHEVSHHFSVPWNLGLKLISLCVLLALAMVFVRGTLWDKYTTWQEYYYYYIVRLTCKRCLFGFRESLAFPFKTKTNPWALNWLRRTQKMSAFQSCYFFLSSSTFINFFYKNADLSGSDLNCRAEGRKFEAWPKSVKQVLPVICHFLSLKILKKRSVAKVNSAIRIAI